MTERVLVADFAIPGEPVSKERPRVVNGNTYTPTKTTTAELKVAWLFKAAARGWAPDASSEFVVDMRFWNKTRHRRDIDNLCKLVLDALNGVCWADDSQVTEISAIKDLAPDFPLTTVKIYRLEGGHAILA